MAFFKVLAEFKFQKFFNRGAMIAAVLLLWPAIRWAARRWLARTWIEPDPLWRRHLLGGFFLAGLAVARWLCIREARHLRDPAPHRMGQVPVVLLSAVTVDSWRKRFSVAPSSGWCAVRSALYGAFLVTVLFAIVHFSSGRIVRCRRGGLALRLYAHPHTFHQFMEPMSLLAGFTTLLPWAGCVAMPPCAPARSGRASAFMRACLREDELLRDGQIRHQSEIARQLSAVGRRPVRDRSRACRVLALTWIASCLAQL